MFNECIFASLLATRNLYVYQAYKFQFEHNNVVPAQSSNPRSVEISVVRSLLDAALK